jgi:outer membrane protein assembly factor BamB
MTRTFLTASVVVVSLLASSLVQAENWPCWRGPRGDGTCLETGVPTEWSAEKNIRWKSEIPGLGHASPIVWNDRVFTVSCIEETNERILLCYDRSTGSKLWQTVVLNTPLEKKHTLNSRASSTPATDGTNVYVSFLDNLSDDPKVNQGEMVIAAYDFTGAKRWTARPGVFSSTHGYCSCPVLFENLVIVNGDHDGDSYLVALNRDTGETVWKVARENKTRSYCTPIIRKVEGREQLILSGSITVQAYDPRTGEKIWNIDGPTEQFVASMVGDEHMVYLTAGFPDRHILAIRPNGHGNVTETNIVWRTKKDCAYVPSPVIVGKYFLVVKDDGIALCLDRETGEQQWKSRLGPHYSASLITVGGLAYFLADNGTMTVVRPGPEYDEVARNELGEHCYASPAVSDGELFLRAERHLYCIGAAKGP